MSFGISVRNGVALGLGTVPALGNRGVPGPSLDLNFLSGTLDGSVTFTRSTTATYYNSLGLVTSAAINAARFDYDPTTLQIKGLLMEESRANLLNFSQTFATAGGANNNWADTNLTRTSTTELSPDGTNNALQITASAANGTLISTAAIGTSASRTLSVFLRRVSGTGSIQYTLNNGTTWTTQAITEYWVRYVFPATTAAQRVGFRIVTSGDSICIWGAQLEAGAFETSYIPTVASQVTRAADLATVATSPWFTAASGTIFNQNLIAQTRATGTYTVFTIGTSTTNELRQRYISGALQQQIVETTQSFNQGITPVANTVYRQAMAFEVNNAASSTNGSAATTDTSVTLPTGALTTAYIGMATTSTTQLSGWLQAIKFYPARLQNGQLASLSAGGGPWYALSATMTEGSAVVGFDVYAGFSSSFGSMSSTSITGGLTLAGVFNVTGATNYASVVISGFTSDPGQTPFSKIAVGPIVQSFASASSYSYDGGSGTATWVWSGSTFSLDGSGTSAVVINR